MRTSLKDLEFKIDEYENYSGESCCCCLFTSTQPDADLTEIAIVIQQSSISILNILIKDQNQNKDALNCLIRDLDVANSGYASSEDESENTRLTIQGNVRGTIIRVAKQIIPLVQKALSDEKHKANYKPPEAPPAASVLRDARRARRAKGSIMV